MKLLEALLIFVACGVGGMATGLLITHTLEEVQMQEHRELEHRALMQRTCKVCGSLAKPVMRQETTADTTAEPTTSCITVDYHCECGNVWSAPPLNAQPTERSKG